MLLVHLHAFGGYLTWRGILHLMYHLLLLEMGPMLPLCERYFLLLLLLLHTAKLFGCHLRVAESNMLSSYSVRCHDRGLCHRVCWTRVSHSGNGCRCAHNWRRMMHVWSSSLHRSASSALSLLTTLMYHSNTARLRMCMLHR